MTQFYYYYEAMEATEFEVNLGNDTVRLGQLSLTELAEHLQVGTSSIILDDPDADLGNAGDAILGLQRFRLNETAEGSNTRRVYTGIIGQRIYRRGDGDRSSLRLDNDRQIEVSLQDLNALASLRTIPNSDEDADRPEETVSERIAWILSTPYLIGRVDDNGLVAANTTVMDAKNYWGQTPANVIGDCEVAAGYGWNAFIYRDTTDDAYSLFFDNANTSTAFTSTLRISNVLSDVDGDVDAGTGTTFAPHYDATLTRDPSQVASGVYVPFENDATYQKRDATIARYGRKDITAPNANITSKSRADDVAIDLLRQHKTEDDHIACKVDLPPNLVNHILPGHRIQVKFSHLPGYEAFTWMRVIRRTVNQGEATDRYTLDLDLTPQEGATSALCVGVERTANGTYLPLGGPGPGPADMANNSNGVAFYFKPGLAEPEYPLLGGSGGQWNFPDFGCDGCGDPDYWGNSNAVVVAKMEGYTLSSAAAYTTVATGVAGDTFTVDLNPPSASDGGCVSWIHITQDGENNSLYLCFVGRGTATIATRDDGPTPGRLGWAGVEWERT